MALTGPFARLRKLQRDLADAAKPGGRAQTEIARGVVREVRAELKEQHRTGAGPYGPWEKTTRGKPALVSKKLPQDFRGRPVKGGAEFWSRIKWLRAHHEGHTFAARGVAARANVLRFNRKGRLVKAKRFAKLTRGRAVFARAHTVGRRVLPARPIHPDPRRPMPASWARRINAGASAGWDRWAKRVVR